MQFRNIDEYNFNICIEISLIVNSKIVEPKLFTGVKYNYELEEMLKFPLKVRDLTPMSCIAIEIFHMDKEDDGTDAMKIPVASTVINLFDRENRMREGNWALLLHKDTKADSNFGSNSTSGLPSNDDDCKKINQTLQMIQQFRKKQDHNLSWVDRAS